MNRPLWRRLPYATTWRDFLSLLHDDLDIAQASRANQPSNAYSSNEMTIRSIEPLRHERLRGLDRAHAEVLMAGAGNAQETFGPCNQCVELLARSDRDHIVTVAVHDQH